jgi:hypothetical protein
MMMFINIRLQYDVPIVANRRTMVLSKKWLYKGMFESTISSYSPDSSTYSTIFKLYNTPYILFQQPSIYPTIQHVRQDPSRCYSHGCHQFRYQSCKYEYLVRSAFLLKTTSMSILAALWLAVRTKYVQVTAHIRSTAIQLRSFASWMRTQLSSRCLGQHTMRISTGTRTTAWWTPRVSYQHFFLYWMLLISSRLYYPMRSLNSPFKDAH